MTNIHRIDSNSKLSRVVVHNGVAWFSGIVAANWKQDIAGQTRQILERLDVLLTTVNSNRSMLLSAQIWMKDMATDFDPMNKVWAEWFEPEKTPARATCQVTFDEADIRIELIATAAVLG